jgi:hypothetical protein
MAARRVPARLGALGLALTLVAPAAPAAAALVVLRDGDRITGNIVAKGTQRLRLRTPYGLLVIPRERIERIVHDDGSEEQLNPPAVAPPAPVRLELLVGGSTFWQAWDPKRPPADPSLCFEVRLDGRVVATYVDAVLDPGELRGVLVNSFSFLPDSLKAEAAPGVTLPEPAVRQGRVQLPLVLPAELAGTRRLRLAYRANDGAADAPEWRTLVDAETEVELVAEPPTRVRVEQERGQMRYARRIPLLALGRGNMVDVDSFRVQARVDPP